MNFFYYFEEDFEQLIESLEPKEDAIFGEAEGRLLFQIKDKKYALDFNPYTLDGKLVLNIEFKLLTLPNIDNILKHFDNDTQRKAYIQKFQMSMTKTGNAQEVLRTVAAGIIKYINKQVPDYVTYTAENDSRHNLYRKMFQIIMKKVGANFEEITASPFGYDLTDTNEFWYRRVI